MTVYLVGAGPGDPSLLTLRAAELLHQADVVVHDRLASAEILAMAPQHAQRIDVGKRAGHSTMPQSGITATLIEYGSKGLCVVRLKGGDPFVFGRGGEEAIGLAEAGVPYEIVPGLSSAIAAPAAAGIPITLRQRSLAFTVLTGHEDPEGDSQINWEAHAVTGATLVILMGVGRIGEIARRLQLGGLHGDTPVASIRWATTDRQEVIRTTLAEVDLAGLAAPSTIVVGQVAALDLRWLASETTAHEVKIENPAIR